MDRRQFIGHAALGAVAAVSVSKAALAALPEPVEREIAPGMIARLWGYNGQSPGPTIEVVEGDRVRLFVTNRLPESTSIHWHGQRLPNGMDGVVGLNQRAIPVSKTYVYDVIARRPGTFKVRRNQKPGDCSDPGWYAQPPGTQAFAWQNELPEPARFSAERLNTGEVPGLRRSALDMQVRKPGSASHQH